METILELDTAVDALNAKTKTAVPAARNFATPPFRPSTGSRKPPECLTLPPFGFAQEMIADTHDHRARTVGEFARVRARISFALPWRRSGLRTPSNTCVSTGCSSSKRTSSVIGPVPLLQNHRSRRIGSPCLMERIYQDGRRFSRGRQVRLGATISSPIAVNSAARPRHKGDSSQGNLLWLCAQAGIPLSGRRGTVSDLGSGVALDPGKPDGRIPDRRDQRPSGSSNTSSGPASPARWPSPGSR